MEGWTTRTRSISCEYAVRLSKRAQEKHRAEVEGRVREVGEAVHSSRQRAAGRRRIAGGTHSLTVRSALIQIVRLTAPI